MAERTIFYRVTVEQNGELAVGGGAFGDLKTLKGATRRLERRHPNWKEIEVQYEPFPTPAPRPEADVEMTFDGSLWMARPLNDDVRKNIEENVSDEAQWFGGAVAVEHRFAGAFIEKLTANGYRVRVL